MPIRRTIRGPSEHGCSPAKAGVQACVSASNVENGNPLRAPGPRPSPGNRKLSYLDLICSMLADGEAAYSGAKSAEPRVPDGAAAQRQRAARVPRGRREIRDDAAS